VTCRTWPEISASDRLVEEALGRRGVSVVAVVLRSNWDYHFTPDEFVAWLDRWEAAGPIL
jgi:predicted deacetylase